MSAEDSELDPRIQIELENLNSATDEINKLEIELEEANSTFRILLNESTRRLKLSSKKLGNCIEKARPYYESLEKSREAQIECQKAAVKFQRANEIHAAAKETVALAEQRFMSNSHEWQFDNAWQEMLNHATQKVMDAEKQKADCHAEHQRRTKVFHAAEQKVTQLEERFRRSITKSRPYFEEKQICQDQLQTQKNRIQELQGQVQSAKATYATALRNLERISDDIHRQRGDYVPPLTHPTGPREPGVGAELNTPTSTEPPSLPDFQLELEKCDYASMASSQMSLGGCSSTQRSNDFSSLSTCGASLAVAEDYSEMDEEYDELAADYAENNEHLRADVDESDLEALRQKVKILAVRPIEGGDGQQEQNDVWEHELNATVDKLDHLLMMKECAKKQQQQKLSMKTRPDSLGAEAKHSSSCSSMLPPPLPKSLPPTQLDDNEDVIIISDKGPLIKISPNNASEIVSSLPATPAHEIKPLKKLHKLEPLPLANVSMRELPLLARLSTDMLQHQGAARLQQRRRSLE